MKTKMKTRSMFGVLRIPKGVRVRDSGMTDNKLDPPAMPDYETWPDDHAHAHPSRKETGK